MPLFAWRESYSIGNEELDHHHRTLFSIMNRLYDSSLENDNKDSVHPQNLWEASGTGKFPSV